ncbi:MAG: carbohydrate ABC transporter permease [Halanaerobiales bacterium]|nr:carbohydrate ABC transporter permease [Halanaerobiales bacterium]
MTNSSKERIHKTVTHVFLMLGAVLTLVPFVWMLSTCFKDINHVFTYPPKFIPEKIVWDNFARVFEIMDFGRYYLNNFIITFLRIFGLFFTVTMAGYGFGRLEFPGKNILFMCLLCTMMIPIYVIMYSSLMVIKTFGWVDTYRALVIPQMLGAFGGAFSIFLLKQNFQSIPKELEEAAIIDGAGPIRLFWSIMLPQVKPAFAALAIFSFNSAWNDFIWPLIVTNSDKMKMLSLGIARFSSDKEGLTQWPEMMAASLMALLPVIILFIIAQKGFIENASQSGIKG